MDSLKIKSRYHPMATPYPLQLGKGFNDHGLIPGTSFKAVNGSKVVLTVFAVNERDDYFCWIFGDGDIEQHEYRGGHMLNGYYDSGKHPNEIWKGYELINYPSDADIEDWYIDGKWVGWKMREY